MTVGGVDTYYDYDERQWKSRKLGGGPIRRDPVCPAPRSTDHFQPERTPPSRDHADDQIQTDGRNRTAGPEPDGRLHDDSPST
jgi:hypothetical protein